MAQAEANKEWEGPYIGFLLGYGNTKADLGTKVQQTTYFNLQDAQQMNKPILSKNLDDNDLNASITVGYNKQNKNLVYGLEADITFSNYHEKNDTGNIAYTSLPGRKFRVQNELKNDWLISITPRIGYATKKSLFFLSAGPALTHIDYKFKFEDERPENSGFSKKDWKFGWTGSIGYEHILNNNWILKMEYSYSKFNDIIDAKSQLSTTPADGFNHQMDLEINNFQIGFVKKF
jgi:outer membrane immunogenic protein